MRICATTHSGGWIVTSSGYLVSRSSGGLTPTFFSATSSVSSLRLDHSFRYTFIRYNTDLFTVFDAWLLNGLENGIA